MIKKIVKVHFLPVREKMRALAFILILLICPMVAMDKLEDLHSQGSRLAEKRIQDLQKHIMSTLEANTDVAKETVTLIRQKLDKLQTSPPHLLTDPFREEFVPLLELIKSPEQFFSETQRLALIGTLSMDNLNPLKKSPAPLKRCFEKWQAIVAHAESIILGVNQTQPLWFHNDWEVFVSKIAIKISNFDLTPDDLLEVFNNFLYFYNQLSGFKTANRNLQTTLIIATLPESLNYLINVKKELTLQDLQILINTNAKLPESLNYLISVQKEFTVLELQTLINTNAKLPEPLNYLMSVQEELTVLYQKRSRILWEILSATINVPEMPKNFDEIPQDYFADVSNPIKKLLLRLTKEKSHEQPIILLPPRRKLTPVNSLSDPTPEISSLTTAGSLSEMSIESTDLSSVPKLDNSEMSVDSEQSPLKSRSETHSMQDDTSSLSSEAFKMKGMVSGSGSSTPENVRSTKPVPRLRMTSIKVSTPQNLRKKLPLPQDGLHQEPEEPSIQVFSDGSDKNASFIARFKTAFLQPPKWDSKVQNFNENVKYLKNVKFVLHPLQALFENYENFKDKLITYNDRTGQLLTPSAIIRMNGQTAKIAQPTAYNICSLEYSGSLCMSISDKSQQSVLALHYTRENLTFSIKENYPFRIGAKLALYYLDALFGIDSAPSAFICVKDVLTYKSKKPKGSCYNSKQYEACVDYLNDNRRWERVLKHEFVMAQQTNTNQTLDAWLRKVISGDRPFTELCPFSYGVATLFSFITRSKAVGDKFVLEPHGDSLRLKRVGFNSFFDPSFQENKGKHLFTGQNLFCLLPYAKQKIPENVKEHFRKLNVELICAEYLTFLVNQQTYFNELIFQYNLDTPDDFGSSVGLEDLTQTTVLGLSMSHPRDTILQLISNFYSMIRLLNIKDITYLQVLHALEPCEAVLFEVFYAQAAERLKGKELKKFFKKLIPAKIAQLDEVTSGMKMLGWSSPYSAEEINLIKKTAKTCLETLGVNNAVSLGDLLPKPLNPKVEAFFQQIHEWAIQTGFFEAIVGNKAHGFVMDAAEKEYYYEVYVEKYLGKRPNFSWDSVPVLKLQFPDYIAAVVEANHPVKGMVDDAFVLTDISKMSASSALKTVDLLLNLDPQPSQYHSSWVPRLFEIAKNDYFSISPKVLLFIEGLGFTEEMKIAALEQGQLHRFKDYEACLHHVGEKLSSRSRDIVNLETCLPGYIFRQLLTVPNSKGYTEKELQLLTSICDRLLFPLYSSLESNSNEIADDPGCLGLASNPFGKQGIWEIHPRSGDHYLLTWSEICLVLYQSPDLISEWVKSVIRSHPMPLLCLQWLHAQQSFGLNTEFHPWLPKLLIKKLMHLPQLMIPMQPTTFKDTSALAPEIQFVIEKMFESQRKKEYLEDDIRIVITPEEREIKRLKDVLKKIHLFLKQRRMCRMALR